MNGLKWALALMAACLLTPAPGLAQDKTINFSFRALDGRQVDLDHYRGQWVLVNFWAPWCPQCWSEFPDLLALDKRPDLVVIAVAMDYGDDESEIEHAVRKHGLEYEAIIPGGSRESLDSAYRQVGPVDFYPCSYLYSPSGELVRYIPGRLSRSNLEKSLVAKKSGYARVVARQP